MRKHGIIFVALLLLLAPSLANAWTIYVKVQGSSSDGTVTIKDVDDNVVATLKGGQSYVQVPDGAATATVDLATNIAADVTIDYNTTPQTDATADYPLVEGTSSLVVAWGQAASAMGDVSVDKTVGGSTLVQYMGHSTMTGYEDLAYGTTVGVKANPHSDYKVASIKVSKLAAGETVPVDSYPAFTAASAGQAVTVGVTVDQPTIEVSATYALVPVIKPVLSAPLRAVAGKPIVLNANGTTSNTAVNYAFSVTGALPASQSASEVKYFVCTPNTAGTMTATVTVSDASNSSVFEARTATIEVITASAQTNKLCLGCHTGSTPAVITAYNSGSLKDTPCVTCHTESPHAVADPDVEGFDHSGSGAGGPHTNVGIAADICANCHNPISTEWADSRHASGGPSSGLYTTPATFDDDGNRIPRSCSECHAPNLEVRGDFTGDIAVDKVPGMIGCTGCHGEEKSVSVAVEVCVDCHNTGHHSSATQSEKVMASKHAKEDNHGFESNGVIRTSGACLRCHSLEGAIALGDVGGTGSDSEINAALASIGGTVDSGNPPTCAACHDPHTTELRVIAGWDPNGNGPDQFDTCTGCHPMKDNAGVLFASGTDGLTNKMHHNTSWYRNIATTHFDDPTTTDRIEGYVIREKGGNPCFDCHGHELRTNTSNVGKDAPVDDPDNPDYGATVFTEWSGSGHAGGLLTAKLTAIGTLSKEEAVDAAMDSGTTTGLAWVEEGYAGASDKCKRCHTATGAAAYLSDPVTYDASTLDYSHLAEGQREMLYCWGCHSDAEAGKLRTVGAVTADYTQNGAAVTFPEVGASNICIACHAGRESGGSITTLTDFTNVGFKNSHYMAAAGLMYVKIGYTNFVDPLTSIGTSTYGASLTSTEDGGALKSTHRKFGTPAIIGDHGITAEDNMDANGPCVVCHMSEGHHTLAMDAAAYENVCAKCHTAEGELALTAENYKEAFVEEQAVPFQNALALAEAKLDANFGITYSTTYPYWYKNGAAVKDWTIGGTVDGEKLMGACFNINLLKRDPAAYVHARTYARRLLYDTIDWLDDQVINLSVSATAVAWNPTMYVIGADATEGSESMLYLKGYNRTSKAWNDPERP